MKQKTNRLAQFKQWILSIVIFRSSKCECEFEGAYHIRASNMTVEMNCKKCNKLHSWTFEQWEQMFPE